MKTNILEIGAFRAVVSFDPEAGHFRGEFLGLNGGADFYADSVEGLQREGKASLDVFLACCEENGIEPIRQFSGKFQVRVPTELHAHATERAAALGISLNQFIQQAVEQAIL